MPAKESKTHVALLVSPGMGHLIPFLELANRLVLHHNLHVTLFAVVGTESSAADSLLLLHNSSAVIDIVPLRPSTLDDPTISFVHKINAMMAASFPILRSSLDAANPRPAALIVDLFGTPALAMARELGMLGFVFFTGNAWFLSLPFFFPAIDKPIVDAHVYNHEPLLIPGCTPVRFDDTLEIFEVNRDDLYAGFTGFARALGTADGILANTWQDLEPTTLKALAEAGAHSDGRVNEVPIYPIGPLVRPGEPNLESEVVTWLDRQPDESVIYVSFGSGGTFREEQITELAWGLELSQQRFVWVVKPPPAVGSDSVGTLFFTAGSTEAGSDDSPPPPKPEYLPEGFIERTKEVGLVVPMWGPQAEILSHRSVRGFLTHCGWNSSIEGIVNGVTMVAWPLYAEQKMNAAMLTEEVGVAVRVAAAATEEQGVVGREEIEKKVRKIMEDEDEEGRGIRERVKELKISGEKAVSKGGSSYNSLARVAAECDISRRQRELR